MVCSVGGIEGRCAYIYVYIDTGRLVVPQFINQSTHISRRSRRTPRSIPEARGHYFAPPVFLPPFDPFGL